MGGKTKREKDKDDVNAEAWHLCQHEMQSDNRAAQHLH